jgi:hypothetical protein
MYGVSSFTVFLTNLVDPTSTIWISSHAWVVMWSMFVYQISLFIIMVLSMLLFGKYIWKNLRKLEKAE